MKKIAAFLFFALILVGAYLSYQVYQFAFSPLSSVTKETLIEIAPGTSFGALKSKLDAQSDRPIDPLIFKLWLKLRGPSAKLKIGEYQIKTDGSAYSLLEAILNSTPLSYKFTLKEGTSIYDFLALVANLNLPDETKKEIKGLLTDTKLWQETTGLDLETWKRNSERAFPEFKSLNFIFSPSLEGFLFPETYTYHKYDSAKTLMDRILAEFKTRALPILIKHPELGGTPEGRYRLLTLASIVEKESGNFEEQPLVSSVFWNRINKRMRLQSDPTTIYGLLPYFDGNLKRIHLTSPTAFNTYTLRGLPISPISSPGESALKAVLSPAPSKYLYFVSRGDGTHVFSTNLKEHNENVRVFQLKKKKP